MAGGQQITSEQGSVTSANSGDVTGSESTSAAGTTAPALLLPLRSRKAGTGTASALLVGQASVGGTGVLTHEEAFALVGQVGTLAQGTLLYRGRATINWNANSEPDLAGYRVYHGTTTGGPYPDVQDVGNVLTYQWNGLLPGFTHYFVVRAYDTSNNESANSTQVLKVF